MNATYQSFREPLRATLIRNGVIAICVATVIVMTTPGSNRAHRWMVAVILLLWPTFGGHCLEVGFLDWLRPRLPESGLVQRAARLAAWFLGGCALGACMLLTARVLNEGQVMRWPAWWVPGAAFVGIELIVHGGLQLRGMPSFFNGRG